MLLKVGNPAANNFNQSFLYSLSYTCLMMVFKHTVHSDLMTHSLDISCVMQLQVSGLSLMRGVITIEETPAKKAKNENEHSFLLNCE